LKETKKICFLQVAHLPDDERVWFHQAKTLKDNDFCVSVVSTRIHSSECENVFCFEDTGMKKSVVCKKISEILQPIHPNIIICDNPLSVFFASRYRKKYNKKVKIVMDITEWYPSKKNLVYLSGFKRFVKKMLLKCLNLCSGFWADGFIFGEYHKAKLFKRFFKRKPTLDLPYYPDLIYIDKVKPKEDFSSWNFLYCGLLTKDKGFYNVLETIKRAAKNNPNHNFIFHIISNDILDTKKQPEITDIPTNLVIKSQPFLPFIAFCSEICKYDIFFDLREKDKENNQCLPIKLFYYMACGRPSIFSDLEAIKLQVPEIAEFAYLSNPNDYYHLANIVTEYVTNSEKYAKHSAAALRYANEKYNWKMLSNKFLKFISSLCD
jgi:glycosyltransferase involved in cell wall biosynthesis